MQVGQDHLPPFPDLYELHSELFCLDFMLALAQGNFGKNMSASNGERKGFFSFLPSGGSLHADLCFLGF